MSYVTLHVLYLESCLNTCECSHYVMVESCYPIKLPIKNGPQTAHDCVSSGHCLKERKRWLLLSQPSPVCLMGENLSLSVLLILKNNIDTFFFQGENWPAVQSTKLWCYCWPFAGIGSFISKLPGGRKAEEGKPTGKPWEICLSIISEF